VALALILAMIGLSPLASSAAPGDVLTVDLIGPPQVAIGAQAIYTVQLHSDDYAQTRTTVDLPDGVTFVKEGPGPICDNSGCHNSGPCAATADGTQVVCTILQDNAGSFVYALTLAIADDVPVGTQVDVSVSSVAGDLKTPVFTKTSTAVQSADLGLSLESVPTGLLTAGRPITYTVVVVNNGPATVEHFTVFSGFGGTFYGGGDATNPEADCFSDPGSLICDVTVRLAPGEKIRLQYVLPTRADADTWGKSGTISARVDDLPYENVVINPQNDQASFRIKFAAKPGTPTTSPTTTTPPTHASSSPPAGGNGGDSGDGGGLPITGAPIAPITVTGLIMLLLGAATLWATRRRSRQF
jgi:hypothetical protein